MEDMGNYGYTLFRTIPKISIFVVSTTTGGEIKVTQRML